MEGPTSTAASRLRERLRRGERVIGTIVKLPSDEVVDVLAGAGLDFVMIDLEHSQLAEGEVLRLLRHGYAIGLPCVARIAKVDSRLINRLLESGATGIQLSTIRTVNQVDDLVAACRYPPHGRRSMSLNHPVAGYGATTLREAVDRNPPLLVGQIETAATDDPLKDIAAAGVDVLFAGTVDVAVDLGFDGERVAARVGEIAEAAAAAGLAFGAYGASASALPEGATYAVLSADLALLRDAALELVADARR
jgi:4-hydroxy-2-oxoheptanedioate aldolase